MPLLRQNDVLFAFKALAIMPDLSVASRRVAGAIIDHFNKKTGQCDPSVGRLTKLLRISRAAVLRATKELDELGLIQKLSHGGKSHRTAYLPNWQMFRAFVEDWDQGMKSGDGPSEGVPKASELRPSTSQTCDRSGLKNETQTHRKNPSKRPKWKQRKKKPKLRASRLGQMGFGREANGESKPPSYFPYKVAEHKNVRRLPELKRSNAGKTTSCDSGVLKLR
ncbi:helix-turn-helix domain-containing protein [Roseibium sp. TrichSKD4]|uniref:helix-turn-helix domain-containing protein n=1 Tax=Roseibium sp. TrichSKD4 TaxID=744980 RepID=UPI00058DD732|nr:helix-turn-helix domain-containing protein [Roseibium sp. TrichSKD4]